VLMPLAYTGSVLALILAAGTASGVGIVISLTPAAAAGSVIARRVILWTALGNG
jgi:hypothetical protein